MEAGGGRLRAAAVAQYLHSAIASSKRPSESPGAPRQEPAPGDSGGGSFEAIGDQDAEVAHTTVRVAGDGDVLTESRRESRESNCGDNDDATFGHNGDLRTSASASGSKYTVTYECYSAELEPDLFPTYKANGPRDTERMQFIDVLLQPDAHGLGLNIQVEPRSRRTCTDTKSSTSSSSRSRLGFGSDRDLVVASFRRLHAHDVGPAEATRQIRRGDILHSVDGERVHSWQHLLDVLAYATAQQSGGSSPLQDGENATKSPFLLLRFLRRHAESPLESPVSTALLSISEAEDANESNQLLSCNSRPSVAHSVGDRGLQNPHHVARLIHELRRKNETLEEELVASRLKQEEQRIHLEQLYALYAKTRLDTSPLFALPKASLLPFARRSTAGGDTGGFVAARLGTKSDGTSKAYVEIELAVRAEQDRLRSQYDLQLSLDRRETAARHEQELAQLRASMNKKLEMVEAGLQEALLRPLAAIEDDEDDDQEGTIGDNAVESCSCGTWLQLQQELYIHQSLDHTGDSDIDSNSDSDSGSKRECLVCHLLTDAKRTTSTATAAVAPLAINDMDTERPRLSDVPRLERVLALVREYEAIRAVRIQRFSGATSKFAEAIDASSSPLQP